MRHLAVIPVSAQSPCKKSSLDLLHTISFDQSPNLTLTAQIMCPGLQARVENDSAQMRHLFQIRCISDVNSANQQSKSEDGKHPL